MIDKKSMKTLSIAMATGLSSLLTVLVAIGSQRLNDRAPTIDKTSNACQLMSTQLDAFRATAALVNLSCSVGGYNISVGGDWTSGFEVRQLLPSN